MVSITCSGVRRMVFRWYTEVTFFVQVLCEIKDKTCTSQHAQLLHSTTSESRGRHFSGAPAEDNLK